MIMNYWEIKEDYDDFGLGMKDDEVEEAYKEGCRHGYEKAMRAMRGRLGRRDSQDGMNERVFPPYIPEPMYRDPYEDMGERRRRDSRGRYM